MSIVILVTIIPCTGMHVLKLENLEIYAALNTLFGHFLITDYGFNSASKTGNLGLNASFYIEFLINLLKTYLIFLSFDFFLYFKNIN